MKTKSATLLAVLLLLSSLPITTATQPENCFEDFDGGDVTDDGHFYGTITVKIKGLCGKEASIKNRLENGVYNYLERVFMCENHGSISSVVLSSWKEAKSCKKLKKDSKESVAQLQYAGVLSGDTRRLQISTEYEGRGDFANLRNLAGNKKGLACQEKSGCNDDENETVVLAEELQKMAGFESITSAKITNIEEADCSKNNDCNGSNGVCCGVDGCTCGYPSISLCDSNACCIKGISDKGFCADIGFCGSDPCADTTVQIEYEQVSFEGIFFDCVIKNDTVAVQEKMEKLSLALSNYIECLETNTDDTFLFADVDDFEFDQCEDETGNTFSPLPMASEVASGSESRRLNTESRYLNKKKSKGRGKKGKKKAKDSDRRLLGNREQNRRTQDDDCSCDGCYLPDDTECSFQEELDEVGLNVTEAEITCIEPFDIINVGIPNDLFTLLNDTIPDSTLDSLTTPGTPQFKAMAWLAADPRFRRGEYDDDQIIQRYALAVFFWSTNGLQYARGWMDYFTDECLWFGIFCNTDGLILSMRMLFVFCNEAKLPKELVMLENLEYLALMYNYDLDGTIPTELGNLKNLTYLILYDNSLTGTIPTELGGLSNLIYLDLGDQEPRGGLNGTIPTELGELTNLEVLWLENNDLEGPIPNQFGNLESLVFMGFFGNDFTGTIPGDLCNVGSYPFLEGDCSVCDATGQPCCEFCFS